MDKKVNIYPIPVNNTIHFESSTAIESFQITGITGELIYKKENIALNSFDFDMSGYDLGIYVLLIHLKDDQIPIIKKILKQ